MAAIRVNKIIPGMAIAFLLIVGYVFFKTNTSGGAVTTSTVEAGAFMARAPVARTADADTPNDTIRALRGQMNVVTDNVIMTQKKNDKLMAERDEALLNMAQADSKYEERLIAALKKQDDLSAQKMDRVLDRFNEAVTKMTDKVGAVSTTDIQTSGSNSLNVGANPLAVDTQRSTLALPEGFGLGLEAGTFLSGEDMIDVFWIEPLDVSINDRRRGSVTVSELQDQAKSSVNTEVNKGKAMLLEPLKQYRELLTSESSGSASGSDGGGGGGLGGVGRSRGLGRPIGLRKRQVTRVEPQTERYYTIPDLSVLPGSTAITSLVGKIYPDGQIVEPQLFKIVVGRDNIAANGTHLPPEIEGMIFEGFAVGHFSRRCVTGNLIAATFIFEDGTVRSMYPGDPGSRPQLNDQSRSRIGYISDVFGNPCIEGELITDVKEQIGAGVALATLGAYSAAIRESQRTVTDRFNQDGNISTTTVDVDGDVQQFALASGVLGGVDVASQKLEELYGLGEAAIYRRAGARVDIHLQQELRLDISPSQRKVRYRNERRVQEYLD